MEEKKSLFRKGALMSLLIGVVTGPLFAQEVGIGTTIPAARLDIQAPATYTADLLRVLHGSNTYLVVDNNGNVGIGTAAPAYRLHVANDGMIYAEGAYGTGDTIPPGSKTAFIWNPYKAAIRAGGVTGNQWDNANIGIYSIALGYNSTASGAYSTVSGGWWNSSNYWYSTVSGGYYNTASGWSSTVSGGFINTASNWYSIVSGGFQNTASGWASTVNGGVRDTASGNYSTVGGGLANSAAGSISTVGGGYYNTASGNLSTVGGGYKDTASGYASIVGGGRKNVASGDYSTVGGGYSNIAGGDSSTVSGGYHNMASASKSTIGGGYDNVATGLGSTIGGGYGDSAGGRYSVIGGGYNNSTIGHYSVVNGGFNNSARGIYSVAGGGYQNITTGHYGVLNGGYQNHVSGYFSVVGGGYQNGVGGYAATVVGGLRDTASGWYSTVCGGQDNTVESAYSWAGGRGMKLAAGAAYTFVWGHNHVPNPPTITADSAFLIGPNGMTYMVGINLDNPTYALHLPNNTNQRIGKAAANQWISTSDARVKTAVSRISGQDAIRKVAQLRPVHYFHHSSRWSPDGKLELLKEGEYRYGFLAQELVQIVPEAVSVPADTTKALYGISYDELIPILTAAIQAQQKTIERLEIENDQQRSRIEDLNRRLSAIETQCNGQPLQ